MDHAVRSILRSASRDVSEKLNILCFPTHERVCSSLARTGHNFFAWRSDNMKDWNSEYAPVPKNYVLLNPKLKAQQLPQDITFDLVFSQSKYGQFQIGKQLATQLNIPLLSLEHTLPYPEFDTKAINHMNKFIGDANVFVSEYNRDAWGWPKDKCAVIHNGIDVNHFVPPLENKREKVCLSVVNDWVNRDVFCGFYFWKEATEGFPVKVFGSTPGLSEPAKNIDELIEAYQKSLIFVNTSLVSTMPTVILEAMACGCAVVSTATTTIPEFIQHGHNGMLCDSPQQMRETIKMLMNNIELCVELGYNARKTILEKFSLETFVQKWDWCFRQTANILRKD